MIHVCSLARLNDTVKATGARHVVTLLGIEDHVPLPPGVDPRDYLRLHMHDITEPVRWAGDARRRACGAAGEFCPAMEPRGADGDPLLRRDQPLDSGRLHHGLRPQSAA